MWSDTPVSEGTEMTIEQSMTKEQIDQTMKGLPLITLDHATAAEHIPGIIKEGIKPSFDGYVYFALYPRICKAWIHHKPWNNEQMYIIPVTFTRAEFLKFERNAPGFETLLFYDKFIFCSHSAWRIRGSIPKEKINSKTIFKYIVR